MKRIKLVVAYDGTDYCGWQIQPNSITVEKILNQALTNVLKKEIKVIGASRTDSGVHAMGNVAVFDTDSTIPPERFSYVLNSILPKDIVVQSSCEVPCDFHPRHCDTVKLYEYKILNTEFQIPQLRNFTWHVSNKLDISDMLKASQYFIGEHDFKSFCSVKTQAETTVRTIYSLDIIRDEETDIIRIRIKGNGFLYNMVRIIAGNLVQVGKGQISPEKIKEILDNCDRTEAGMTAPPQGLTLMGITYL